MSYVKTEWATGDVITAQKLNNMEDGIETLDEYADIFTADVSESVENWLDDHPEATTTVQDNAITTAKLQDGAVTTPKLANGSVTDDKLASDGIKAEVSDLKSDLNLIAYGEPILPTAQEAWIRYSNGELVASNATYCFIFTTESLKKVKAFLTSDSNALCGIAFYSTSNVSTSGYIQSASKQFPSGNHNSGEWYEAVVPSNAKCVAITTKKPSDSVAQYQILFNEDYNIQKEFTWTENVLDVMPFHRVGEYMRYSDGLNIGSGTYFHWYSIPNYGFTKVRAKAYFGDTIPVAIAFYSSEIDGVLVDTTAYMKSDSLQAIKGAYEYEAEVPSSCKTIIFCSRDNTGFVPSIQFLADEYARATFDRTNPIEAISRKFFKGLSNPFKNHKCFGHLFVNQVTASFSTPIIIPCQSIFDVQVTARLGFKYIEANVHKTSDGKYVVTHGISGKLGNDFEDLSGNAVDVTISQTTFDTLRTNYRYRSTYPKYKVPISSLEEFCNECKRWNIGAVLQFVDLTELEIARGILGDNIILYNTNFNNKLREWWGIDETIMEFQSLTTKAEILARCETVGKPYMYNMANPQAFTEAELKEIISAVHEEGYLIGMAGVYESRSVIYKYFGYGFDFSASGLQVNDFESGNIENYCDDLTFDGITQNGTIEDGILHLADGEYLEVTGDTNFLTKLTTHITFIGKLYWADTNAYMESDGSGSVWDSCFYNNATPTYKLVSDGDTYIKSLIIKVSKC